MLKFLLFAFLFSASTQDLEKAKIHYETGLATKNSLKKNYEWNLSLNELLNTPLPTAETLSSLAILLAEFQEYEFASYYLREALTLDPNNEVLLTQLKEIIELGHLPQTLPLKGLNRINRPQFFAAFLLSFLLAFLWCKWPNRAIMWLFFLSLIPLTVIGALFFVRNFLNPIEGVLVQSSYLYQGPAMTYDLVSNEPLSAGLLVDVLDAPGAGQFIKIQTENKIVGFIPEQSIRVLH